MDERIESRLTEKRLFPPPLEWEKSAHITPEKYAKLVKKASDDLAAFWGDLAAEHLSFEKPWEKVLDDSKAPFYQWFTGAKLNISSNCLDRHLPTRAEKTALIWEGEEGKVRRFTFRELHAEVVQLAQGLLQLGVKKGDVVTLYLPMIPELLISLLACARIGAIHSVVFGGFSSEALRGRIEHARSSLLITADGGYRRGEVVPLKRNADLALEALPSVKRVLVVKRTGESVPMDPKRDLFVHELHTLPASTPPLAHDAEDPLFILYTSGTTGQPKGILHTTAGYLLQTTVSAKWVFNLTEDDVYWCTADIGWVTGHSYIVYGILANGVTTCMYEGAPNYPDPGRVFQFIEKHRVTKLYTAPTAIRAFMRWGDEWVHKHQLDSLKLLGTVGEPINPSAWTWYHEVVGKKRCPIVDTWWQTETGAILISPLPGVVATKPGSATLPLPGIFPEVVDKEGKPCPPNKGGYLVLRKPWPSMLRTIYGDPERYVKQYFSQVPGAYFTGDGARSDEDHYVWVMGRVDDVVNVSGHRLSTMEVESALVSHPAVTEAAVVGRPDPLKGQALVAFATLSPGAEKSEELKEQLRRHVAQEIGAIARPDAILFAESLPKTRSGKIMRRLLRHLAAHEKPTGDISTLEDQSVLEKLSEAEE